MALGPAAGTPSDFSFAVGDWHVRHRRLRERLVGCTEWVEFDGEMSTQPILGGFGNVEDNLLHLPEGPYRAIALRSFNPGNGQWSIWWLDSRQPGQIDVPVVGAFEDGIGTFYADGVLNAAPVRIRFLWYTGDPDHPRWEQAFSADGGVNWETNWRMNFYRARDAATFNDSSTSGPLRGTT
ncbi:MAG TPA: DUF1579 domain-containing protein [Noviherbaspirillum sp.]|jgi:hypothetical protein|uniref:DUF1579 domain-containing protein n=1 Tax=Noviherbaspirillum sp. TaxID=1926288 RepID=UPI002DDD2568|nr:DUF1579 domain-containing protein [Noviherbaspirillum sp.]HEV2610097.1 DUF1579 domain-containing protein [Noviherbaspirillum sp.]